jgi:hypothetical protein
VALREPRTLTVIRPPADSSAITDSHNSYVVIAARAGQGIQALLAKKFRFVAWFF